LRLRNHYNMDGQESEHGRSNLIVKILLAFSVGIFVFLYLVPNSRLNLVFSWLKEWGQVISGFGSLALTGYLAYLYTQIAETQSDQVDAMKSQSEAMDDQIKWMAAQETPDIWISNLEIYSGHLPPLAGKNDYLAIKLKNEGSGAAKNLHQRCDIWVIQDEKLIPIDECEDLSIDGWDFRIESGRWNLSRVNRYSLSIKDASYQFRQRTQGGILPASEEHWYFSQVNVMIYPEENGHSISFQDAMLLLEQAGMDKVAFQISLLYRDPAGDIQGKSILSGQHELGTEFTLEGFEPYGGFSGSISQIVENVREEGNLPPYGHVTSEQE
jgi:hypothetical protein